MDGATGSDAERWLPGALVTADIARPRDEVWDFLLDIGRTPEWRFHLGSVAWMEPGPPAVGSCIDVTTSLLWYRNVHMSCEVTHLDPDAGLFAYRVIDGPATTENQYRVTARDGGTHVVMQGRVLLDSWLMRLTGPVLKLASDRLARREMVRLAQFLEAD